MTAEIRVGDYLPEESNESENNIDTTRNSPADFLACIDMDVEIVLDVGGGSGFMLFFRTT